LLDRLGGSPVDRGVVVPRRVDVGGVMGAEGDRLPRPALAVTQQVGPDPEQPLDLGRAIGMTEVLNIGALERRSTRRTGLDGSSEIYDPDRGTLPKPSRIARSVRLTTERLPFTLQNIDVRGEE
jgi:hypothetical protein